MQQAEGMTDGVNEKEEAPPLPVSLVEQTPPPVQVPKKKRYMKSLVWMLSGIVLLSAICVGAYYYYLEFVKAPQYAKQIVQLYEDLKATERLLGSHDVQDSLDYPAAIDTMNKREEILVKTQNRLSDIKLAKNIFPQSLSPRTHKIQEVLHNFSSMIEFAIVVNADAKQKAVFLEEAYELLVALGRYGPRVQRVMEAVLDPRQPRAVGTILSDWETRTLMAKEIGGDLFAEAPPQLNGTDASQLKTAWEEAFAGLDDIVAYLRAQDPSATLSSSSTVPQPQTEQERQQYPGVEKVYQFAILLDSTLNNNSAQDMVSYRFSDDVSRQNLEDRASAVEKQMTELKGSLPQEDQDQQLQTPEPPAR
jgi:hypothetical protein